MNNFQISDVTSYDFNLLGKSEVELVVRQANTLTTIRLLPVASDKPIFMGTPAPQPTAQPAAQPEPQPQSRPLTLVEAKSTVKRKRSKKAKPGSDRPYLINYDRKRLNGTPFASKLNEDEVKMIRELWPLALEESPSRRQAHLKLSQMFEISAAAIDCIVSRKTWQHVA